MAAPRATQFLAVRNLFRGSQQVRRMRFTGRATYTSPVPSQLVTRVNADELAQSRTFSSVAGQAKRPTSEQSEASAPTRHFHTSRSLRAVGDNSTIDFAYLPSAGEEEPEREIRVPILPNNFTSKVNKQEDDVEVMKHEISTMSADAVFLPMSDLSDGNAMNIDFHAMADRVAHNLKRMKLPAEEQAGMMKQIWSDLVDDMIRVSKKTTG